MQWQVCHDFCLFGLLAGLLLRLFRLLAFVNEFE